MDELQIQYEIKPADYAEANARVVKRSLANWGMWLFLASAVLLAFLPFAYRQGDENWTYPFLVVPFAGFLIYCALLHVLPGLSARIYYSHTNLPKSTFRAYFSRERVKVEGHHVAWVIEWPGFRFISESKRLFVFYDGFTMYVFAKRYFTPDQMSELQELIKQCWKPTNQADA